MPGDGGTEPKTHELAPLRRRFTDEMQGEVGRFGADPAHRPVVGAKRRRNPGKQLLYSRGHRNREKEPPVVIDGALIRGTFLYELGLPPCHTS